MLSSKKQCLISLIFILYSITILPMEQQGTDVSPIFLQTNTQRWSPKSNSQDSLICSPLSKSSGKSSKQSSPTNPLSLKELTNSQSFEDITDQLCSEKGSNHGESSSDFKSHPNTNSVLSQRSISKFLSRYFCCYMMSKSSNSDYILHESHHKSS